VAGPLGPRASLKVRIDASLSCRARRNRARLCRSLALRSPSLDPIADHGKTPGVSR